jgi:hypothetical protein
VNVNGSGGFKNKTEIVGSEVSFSEFYRRASSAKAMEAKDAENAEG